MISTKENAQSAIDVNSLFLLGAYLEKGEPFLFLGYMPLQEKGYGGGWGL